MARLSDIIEEFIKNMFEDADGSELEIQRNELANHFCCAPSQINYVLTTRFTTNRGYYIESKRGGGGCIIIRRVENDDNQSIMDIINEKIGDSITCDGAVQIINGLIEAQVLNDREAYLMKSAVNDRTLSSCLDSRNKVRADILKAMIMVLLL